MAQFILIFPIAVFWMVLNGELSPANFVVGLIIGIVIVVLLSARGVLEISIDLKKLPYQLFWIIRYVGSLALDIFLSSIQVAWLILSNPPAQYPRDGIKKITTGDETRNFLISALSAHAITITPGELVVDYDEDDTGVMYVHCLDFEKSAKLLERQQKKRLALLKRMLGYD